MNESVDGGKDDRNEGQVVQGGQQGGRHWKNAFHCSGQKYLISINKQIWRLHVLVETDVDIWELNEEE